MVTLFTTLNHWAPTLFAVLAVVSFRKRTRALCYTLAVLTIWAELIPMTINVAGLLACVACLAALVVADILRMHSITHPILRVRTLGMSRLFS